jgi:hypothetical protein
MTWPELLRSEANLDLPFLSRPDALLDEAATLFRLLRRLRVTPEEFEAGCASGVREFYGDDIERALVHCAQADVRSRSSRRGREALLARPDRLAVQKRAERQLGMLLATLYREYRAAASRASRLCPEDVVDQGLTWMERDASACVRIASGLGGLIVDDAEDAEPGTARLVELTRRANLASVTIAGWMDSAIDGLAGRRSALPSHADVHIELPPRPAPAGAHAKRASDERAETEFLATEIAELLAHQVRPEDILVMARDEDGAAVYAALLASRGIPITAPPSAWQEPKQVADLLALASIVDDPCDQAHLLRVLASPLVGLSDKSLWTLCRDAQGAAQLSLGVAQFDDMLPFARPPVPPTLAMNALYGHMDHALSDRARESLSTFRERWSEWRSACVLLAAPRALAYLIEGAGFRSDSRRLPEHASARFESDAARLISGAAGYAAASPSSGLKTFVEAFERGECEILPASDVPGAITCTSIVGAKGRRAQYVFVAGVAHERFPRIYVSHAMAFSRKYGLIVRENVAGGAAQTAKFAWY